MLPVLSFVVAVCVPDSPDFATVEARGMVRNFSSLGRSGEKVEPLRYWLQVRRRGGSLDIELVPSDDTNRKEIENLLDREVIMTAEVLTGEFRFGYGSAPGTTNFNLTAPRVLVKSVKPVEPPKK